MDGMVSLVEAYRIAAEQARKPDATPEDKAWANWLRWLNTPIPDPVALDRAEG